MSRFCSPAVRLALLIAVALGLSLSARAPQRVSAVDEPVFTVTFLPEAPKCNGDSVRVTLNISQSDGTPIEGAGAIIVGVDNSVSLRHGPEGTEAQGLTDKQGDFQAFLTPPAGTRDASAFVIGAHGPKFRFIPCPFSSDRRVVAAGTLWDDKDGDGVQGDKENFLPGRSLAIYGGCYSPGCFVPLHWTRSGASGQFEWAGLHQFESSPGDWRPAFPTWTLCIPEDNRPITAISLNNVSVDPSMIRHIVSLVGDPIAPIACVYLGKLEPGVNNFSVGVQSSPKGK